MTKHIKDLQDYLVPHIKPSKTTYTVFRLIKNQENITGNPIAVMHEGQCYELTGWDFKFDNYYLALDHAKEQCPDGFIILRERQYFDRVIEKDI
jgi:hypothetical protein